MWFATAKIMFCKENRAVLQNPKKNLVNISGTLSPAAFHLFVTRAEQDWVCILAPDIGLRVW